MTEPGRSRRRYGVLAALVGAGAGVAALSAGLTWWTQVHVDALAGTIRTTAAGSQTVPLLVPVAVVAVAGFGAALATAGVLRRLVGMVLLVGGLCTALLAVLGARTPPVALKLQLSRPADTSAPAQLHALGAVLAVLAGALIAGAGALMTGAVRAGRALGARYDAPGTRRAAGAATGRRAAAVDPDGKVDAAAGWWTALDAGQDPTRPAVTEPGPQAIQPPGRRSAGVSESRTPDG